MQLLDADSTVGNAFLVSGIPQTVVIDTEGVVQAVHVGYSPGIKSLLSGQIDRLLNGEDLFDPVKVAEARQRRKERREKLLAQLGPAIVPKMFALRLLVEIPYQPTSSQLSRSRRRRYNGSWGQHAFRHGEARAATFPAVQPVNCMQPNIAQHLF